MVSGVAQHTLQRHNEELKNESANESAYHRLGDKILFPRHQNRPRTPFHTTWITK